MKIERKLLEGVFASKRRDSLRHLFGIDNSENIKFVWYPPFNEIIENKCSIWNIRKFLTKQFPPRGVIATDKAIYFPLNNSVCKGNGNKYLLSDVYEISFDSYNFLIIKNRDTNPTIIPISYFCYDSICFINDNEMMAFIIGSLNMLLKNN